MRAALSFATLAAAGVILSAAIEPVPTVDPLKYIGRWYQMYGDLGDFLFESNYCVTADYGIWPNGTISVHNRDRRGGVTTEYPETEIYGWAAASDPSKPAALTVYLQGVPVGAPYWIVSLGPERNGQYQYAVVSDFAELSLFVLARNVTDFNKLYDQPVRAFLQANNYTSPINSPIPTVQAGCVYWPEEDPFHKAA